MFLKKPIVAMYAPAMHPITKAMRRISVLITHTSTTDLSLSHYVITAIK